MSCQPVRDVIATSSTESELRSPLGDDRRMMSHVHSFILRVLAFPGVSLSLSFPLLKFTGV